METKIMNIFYGADSLPYKDSARTVHYPVVGTEFEGASNTTEIHFYVDRIGGVLEPTWVANTKLPNGKVGYKKLDYDTDSENGEHYLILTLSQFYTQAKGDIYISLNGFNGGVSLEQDEDDNYILVGTPTIRTTGCVRLTINYAVQPLPSDIYEYISLDDILAYISGLASDDFVKTRFVPRFSINTTNEDYTTNAIASVLDDFGVVPNFGARTFVLELTRQNNSGVAYLISIQDAGTPTYVKVIDLISFKTGSTSNYDISTKTFSDLIDSDLTWTKYVEQTSQASVLYGTDSDSHQALIPVEDNIGDVARRDNSGQLIVPLTPSANGQATSKKYVDDSISSERTYVDTKLADKQDKLIAGANITISGNVISATGGSGQAMRTEVVNELPDTGENGVIYLVPKDSGTSPDIYDEYVWVEDDNDFEFIGTTAIDLSDYLKKSENALPTTNNDYDIGSSLYTWKDLYLGGKANIGSFSIDNIDTNEIRLSKNGSPFVRIQNNLIMPYTTNTIDLGNNSHLWKDLYLGGTTYIGASGTIYNVSKDGAGYLTISAGSTPSLRMYLDNYIMPDTDNHFDLGYTTRRFKDLYLSGTAYISTIEDASVISFKINGTERLKISGADLITGRPYPSIGSTFDIGTATLKYKDGYFSGNIYALEARVNYIGISGNTLNAKSTIAPDTNNSYDIGINSRQFRDLYLSGNLTDGTNTVTVAQLSGVAGSYATNSTTQLEYSYINDISVSADTTFTLATAPTNTYPEYKANITNTDNANAITITLPSGTIIKAESTISVSSNTFEIPADTTVVLSIQDGLALVIIKG